MNAKILISMKLLLIGIASLQLGWGASALFLFSAEKEKSEFPIPVDTTKVHRFELPSFKDALLGKIDLPSQDLNISQDLLVSSGQTKIDFREALSKDLGLKSLKNDAIDAQNSVVKAQMEAHRTNASVVQASVLKSLGVPITAKDIVRIQSLNATLDRINKGTLNINSLSGSPVLHNLNQINSQTLSGLSSVQLGGPAGEIGNPSVLLPPEGTQIQVGGVGSVGSPAVVIPDDPSLSLPVLGGTVDDPANHNDPLAKLRENLLKLQQAGQQIQQAGQQIQQNLQEAGEKAKAQITENLQKLQQAGQQIQAEAERKALELRIRLCKNIKPEDCPKYPKLKCCELEDHDH